MPDLDNLLNIIQVVLGVGLVIFAHESGHFLAARFCKVRVDVFSLGFGPRLFGFKRGDTTYQVALVPLGGYVRMAGEDAVFEGREPAPDELGAKTVGQRFLIYSGGVIANVIFALVVFPLLFMIGVPFQRPILGDPVPGGPAWHAGLESGMQVLSVNGHEVYDYAHIPTEVALGSPERTVLEVAVPGEVSLGAPGDETVKPETRTIELVPEYAKGPGVYSIGVQPAPDPDATIVVGEDSPASRAGLVTGDRLLAIEGVPAGLTLTEQLAFAQRELGPVTGRFLHEGEELVVTLEPETLEPGEAKLLGVAPVQNLVAAVRMSPLTSGLDIREGDRLLNANGSPILRSTDLLAALVDLAASNEPLRIALERAGVTRTVEGPSLSEADAVALASDIALELDAENNRVNVTPGTAAYAAGLRSGDSILRIAGADIAVFDDIKTQVKTADEGLIVDASRPSATPDGEAEILAPVEVVLAPVAPISYGFGLQPATYVFRTSSPLQALDIGVRASWKFMVEAWRSMKRILLGQVDAKNVGGIITIGKVSSRFAEIGLAKLFFFLCMLSMNLAFLNVLPIPVLDGGHLFFLIIEKIKGSPVSERVLGYSQIVGLVLIVSLMVYVTYNDLVRWVPWFQ